MSRVRFGDVVRDVKLKADRNDNPYEYYLAGEHFDSERLFIPRRGLFEGSDVGPAFIRIFKPGQVLYGSRRTYLKKVAVADFEGITANTTFVLETKDEDVFSQRLLPFILLSDDFTKWSIEHSKGSTNPYVLFSDLAEYEFELPPVETQRKLSDLLWEGENLKEVYRKLLIACDEVVKSRFVEMFGDPAANTHGLPVEKLSNLGVLERGKSKHRPRNAPELRGGPDGPYPLVQTGDITNAGLYLNTYEDTYTELGLQQSRMWPKGTLCITIAANIAQTAILAIDACFPDSVVGFTPGESITNVFLHYWFSFFQGILEEQAPQAAQKNINLKILSELGVITPPIELQQEFAAFVQQVDKSEFALKQAIEGVSATMAAILNQELGMIDV